MLDFFSLTLKDSVGGEKQSSRKGEELMKPVELDYLMTFHKTHSMIKSEVLLREANILARTMPLPTALGDSCGFCLRVKEDELEQSLKILQEAEVEVGNLYRIDESNSSKKYILIEEGE